MQGTDGVYVPLVRAAVARQDDKALHTDMTEKRLYGIDVLKAVCCFSVVLLHAVAYRVESFDGTASWMLANVISSATREAVPVFFMVSGALVLRRDIPSYAGYFLKIARNYTVPLLGGLAAYKLLAVSQGDPTPLLDGVVYNVRRSLAFHLWFMWTFLGLALVAPLLRPMVARPESRRLFLGLWLLFCIVQPWLGRIDVALPVDNMLFVLHTGYYVAGYALLAANRRVPAGWLLFLCGLAVGATAWLTWRAALETGLLSPLYYEGPSPFLVLYSACAFLLCRDLPAGPFPRLLAAVSGATFTVYIYHVLALSLAGRLFGPTTLAMRLLVHAPLAFLACLALDAVGRRIPGLRVFFR